MTPSSLPTPENPSTARRRSSRERAAESYTRIRALSGRAQRALLWCRRKALVLSLYSLAWLTALLRRAGRDSVPATTVGVLMHTLPSAVLALALCVS